VSQKAESSKFSNFFGQFLFISSFKNEIKEKRGE
jgi:hypothetical protein